MTFFTFPGGYNCKNLNSRLKKHNLRVVRSKESEEGTSFGTYYLADLKGKLLEIDLNTPSQLETKLSTEERSRNVDAWCAKIALQEARRDHARKTQSSVEAAGTDDRD